MKREKLKLSTILSYALATGSGYQIMGSLVGAYLMIFLTDTFGVPAGAVGVITVVASIWDAINDPIMGTIADRTKSRWGKYRPYFLFIPAILTVVVVLLFASPLEHMEKSYGQQSFIFCTECSELPLKFQVVH